MGVDFYAMSQSFLGPLPITLYWLYDLMTVVFVIMAVLILLSPVLIILKVIRGGR